MARLHAATDVIRLHKEVVNIKIAGAASKCSAGNAIRILIRLNSLKPLFGTPLFTTCWYSQIGGAFRRKLAVENDDVSLLSHAERSLWLRRRREELRHQIFSRVNILCALRRTTKQHFILLLI